MNPEEIKKDPQFNEMVMATVMSFMRNQQKGLVGSYKIRNQYAKKGQIVLTGSSLMEGFPIAEFQLNDLQDAPGPKTILYNRGIGGFTTQDFLSNLEACVFDLEPAKIFINIGTNDIGMPDYKLADLLSRYEEILIKIINRLPAARIYVMAYYPINAQVDFPGIDQNRKAEMFKTRTNANIIQANSELEKLAAKLGCQFINVNDGLSDDEGNLKAEFAIEGVHLWPNAYKLIFNNLKKYLYE